MINEVDEALRALVKAEILNGADVEVVFDAPTREGVQLAAVQAALQALRDRLE